jgi:predicted nucleic acid-binding protein
MIGLDTGFFFAILQDNERAVSVWNTLLGDEEAGVVSCLTLFELERLGLKRGIKWIADILEAIPAVCKIAWIQSPEVLSQAAALSHGLGIPAVDSLILAGFLSFGAHTIYTVDKHLETYQKKGVKVINLLQ